MLRTCLHDEMMSLLVGRVCASCEGVRGEERMLMERRRSSLCEVSEMHASQIMCEGEGEYVYIYIYIYILYYLLHYVILWDRINAHLL